MGNIAFTSVLDGAYQEALEHILFLNENQPKVYEGALLAVERYETPRISNTDNRLWLTFDSGVETQSLFILDRTDAPPQLIGVVVYTREANVLAVLFLAVREDYAQNGAKSDQQILFSILREMVGIARRIKGISAMNLYLTNPPITLPIANATMPADRDCKNAS